MQINGVNEFFSRIASFSGAAAVQSNTFLPTLTQANQDANDLLSISDIGKKLSESAESSTSLVGKQERKEPIKDPLLELVDDTMSQAENILERMYELTKLAQDEELSDMERVEMQIEIEGLRENLAVLPVSLQSQSTGGPPVTNLEPSSTLMSPDGDENRVVGNGTSVLGRMRARIMNEEEWNVREAYIGIGIGGSYKRSIKNDDGEVLVVEHGANAWHTTKDERIPTVREVLERNTPIIVMDAESAAEGVELLEKQISTVQKRREQIAKADAEINASAQQEGAEPQGRVASQMLKLVTRDLQLMYSPDEKLERSTINDPTDPEGFAFSWFSEEDRQQIAQKYAQMRALNPLVDYPVSKIKSETAGTLSEYYDTVTLSGIDGTELDGFVLFEEEEKVDIYIKGY